MGLFDRLFRPAPRQVVAEGVRFKTLSAYEPVFTRWGGSIYESELVRAAINARATHISKLSIVTAGPAKPSLQNKLRHGPNEWQTWSQFLYRTSTILDVHNTAIMVPVLDQYGDATGIFTVLPDKCEIVEYKGIVWLLYHFRDNKTAAIEFDRCGILTKFQYSHDFRGESNAALLPTMDLIKIQDQGIKEAVKSGAAYRFMATLANFSKKEDLARERKAFTAENLSAKEDNGGLLLWPNTYKDIKQLENKPYVVSEAQMEAIKTGVFNYFGVNEDVIQNKAYGDAWNAFYEGAIEPFCVMFSESCSRMLFSYNERTRGSYIMATANRLQYMSNTDKLNVSAQMADRGIMSRNEIREIWNLPPLPPEIGDTFPVRGEYYDLGNTEEDNAGEN